MATSKTTSILLFLFFFSLISGPKFAMANGQRTWCIAKPSSDEATLLANINYACSQVDCRVMQKGCPCFSPDNLINHASIAMNLYFRSKGCNLWNCDFRGSGLLVITDPSYGNCLYE
ncbi:major pollen allergen Ole e 10 [Amaranthus tricolor]|uniref:major pollen allergen Ole e 10 n=1 Tax=Amaranthus tricolor TaxID=29722 RepID=UPI002586817A|nr:major pollen allergen Ole e 10 [Amaranthus tricolor]